VVYVTPKESHQTALFPNVSNVELRIKEALTRGINVYYVTRFQAERTKSTTKKNSYPTIDKKFLRQKRYSGTRVLHPLPRTNELSYDLDEDPRGAYFRQTAYGVPVRMALIAHLLGVRPFPKRKYETTRPAVYSHEKGIACRNESCISRDTIELRYLKPKFNIVDSIEGQSLKSEPPVLRCVYCEYEYKAMFIGRIPTKTYTTDFSEWSSGSNDFIFFENEVQARKEHFHPCLTQQQTAVR
jgi:hypothetical protein